MIELIHWRQTLNRQVPSTMEIYGRQMNTEDAADRALARAKMARMTDLMLYGIKVTEESKNFNVYYTDSAFLVETYPQDLDSANRVSPILTYGEFPSPNSGVEQDWPAWVQTDIFRFAEGALAKLPRFDPDCLPRCLASIDEKKKIVLWLSIIGCLLPPTLLVALSQRWPYLKTSYVGVLIGLVNVGVLGILRYGDLRKLLRKLF